MLQSLPPNSGLGAMVADRFIEMLYNDLPHPATTLAGPETKYRRHDGGGNNPWNPEMGKAGSPYCRNVPPQKPQGPNLPDPELVYEQLVSISRCSRNLEDVTCRPVTALTSQSLSR